MTLTMMDYTKTNNYNLSQVLNDEAVYDLDLDGDGKVGDTISAVYMDVPDADTGVENPKDNFGLYKTASGSYIADTAGLAVGDQTNEPTLLVKQTVFRGQTSTSLYDFIYTPTGAVTYAEGDGSVYYKDSRDNWFRDNFSKDGVFQTTDSLTLSELRNEEAVHDLDLDGNGKVGDTIDSVLANDGQGKGIFKTTSGSYIIDDSTLSVGDQTNDPTILTQEVARRGPPTIGLKEFDEPITGFVSDNNKFLIYYRDKTNNWYKEEYSKTGIYEKVTNYSLSYLLNDETKYNIDLNKDNKIGDIITEVIATNSDFGLYKTSSGSLIKDDNGLDVGDSSVDPILLTQAVTARRGPTTINLYEFSNTPTGTVALTEGGFGVYYQNSGGAWKRDNFDKDGLLIENESLSLTEVLTHESNHNVDLNKDGGIGEVIITNVAQSKELGLYITASGAYVVDQTNLILGDQTVDPTLLINQTMSRGNLISTLYNFQYNPIGIITKNNGENDIYYMDSQQNWFKK